MARKKSAREKFAAYVTARGSQSVAAQELGCDQTAVSKLVLGRRLVPTLPLAVAIEDAAGIGVREWLA